MGDYGLFLVVYVMVLDLFVCYPLGKDDFNISTAVI